MPTPSPSIARAHPSTSARLTGPLIRSTFVAALGGLLFGFDTAVISGTTEALRSSLPSRNLRWDSPSRAHLIGTIVGSIAAGRRRTGLGRRAHAVRAGDSLLRLGRGLRAGLGLVLAALSSGSWAVWRWAGVGGLADVHRGDLPRAVPRAARGRHAVQHRARRPAGLPLQLHDRAARPGCGSSGGGCSASGGARRGRSSSCCS